MSVETFREEPRFGRMAPGSNNRSFVEIRVRARPALAEAVEAALLEAGAQGTSQEWPGSDRSPSPEPAAPGRDAAREPNEVEIAGYFYASPAPDDATLVDLILRFAPGGRAGGEVTSETPRIRRTARPWEDWVGLTRQALGPFRATAKLWIAPPWKEPDERGPREDLLVIEPGQAFGTGAHATTRGCLALVEKWGKERGGDPAAVDASERRAATRPRERGSAARARGRRLALDVGTGTGILALRALQCGADLVWGNDLDPEAIRAAKRNAERNGLAARTRFFLGDARAIQIDSPGPAPDLRRFDLILANIFLKPLLDLAGFFSAALVPGGWLIVSGFRPADRAELAGAMSARGFHLREEFVEDDWAAQQFDYRPRHRGTRQTRA